MGSHPEASLAAVWQGKEAEVFGGDTHRGVCGALVRGTQGEEVSGRGLNLPEQLIYSPTYEVQIR